MLALLQTGPAFSGALPDILKKAVENDLELKRLTLSLENLNLRVKRERAARGFSLSLGSTAAGSNILSYTHNFEPSAGKAEDELGFRLFLSGNMGDPLCSRIDLDVPITYGFRGDAQASLKTSLAQPLNPLLGLSPHGAEELETSNLIEEAFLAVISREIEVKREILQRIRSLYSLKLQELETEYESSVLIEEINLRESLFQINEESYAYRKLHFDLQCLEQDKELVSRKIDQLLGLLAERIGEDRFTLPEEIPDVELILPDRAQAEANPEVYRAERELRLAEVKVQEQRYHRLPELSLNSSYDWADKRLSFSLGFSMKLLDSGVRRITKMELERAVQISSLSLKEARSRYRELLADLQISVLELKILEKRYVEEEILTALRLREIKEGFERGLLGKFELLEAEWERERLKLEEKILKLDKLLLSFEAEGFLAAARRVE
ncbi:hypothetical protein ES703_68434 [subsurface metagenome]